MAKYIIDIPDFNKDRYAKDTLHIPVAIAHGSPVWYDTSIRLYSYEEIKPKVGNDFPRVGDEINVEGAIRVVTFIADDDLVAAIDKKGDGYAYDLREVMWYKTGKHYDIVHQMLDKIGG